MNLVKSLFLTLAFILPALATASVNINNADAAHIAKELKGIGATKAAAIVAYRNAHGLFKNADDLKHVKGVSQKAIDRNRAMITFSDDAKVATADAPVKVAQ